MQTEEAKDGTKTNKKAKAKPGPKAKVKVEQEPKNNNSPDHLLGFKTRLDLIEGMVGQLEDFIGDHRCKFSRYGMKKGHVILTVYSRSDVYTSALFRFQTPTSGNSVTIYDPNFLRDVRMVGGDLLKKFIEVYR